MSGLGAVGGFRLHVHVHVHVHDPQTPTAAIVRPPAASYASCIREDSGPIDVQRARAQHRAYVEALRAAGIDVHAGDGALSCMSLRFAPDGAWVV